MTIASRVIVVCLLFVLCGCENTPKDIARGKVRHELFVECMELAAKMPRQSDDDVSDIVGECGSQSYYISDGM